MWIRIRAVIIEDEPLAAQYLAELLDETCQVEVVGSATEGEAGLCLCAELRPDAVFVDINLPGMPGEKMEILIFALIASYNAHRQQKRVVAEPEEFQPFDLLALRNSANAEPAGQR